MWKKLKNKKKEINNWLLLRLSIKNCITDIQLDHDIDNNLRYIYIESFRKVLEIMRQIENEKQNDRLHIAAVYDKSFSSLQSVCWSRYIVKNSDIDHFIMHNMVNYPKRLIYIDGERVYNGGYIDKYTLDSVDVLAKDYFEDLVIDTGTVPTYKR